MPWILVICAFVRLGALQVATARIHKEGELRMYDTSAVDLDEGRGDGIVRLDGEEPPVQATESFKGSDFWFQAGNRRYFHPQHGAAFSKSTLTAADYKGCATARYSKGPIRVDALPIGAQICVRTNEGRYARIQINRYEPKSTVLFITYTTWEK